MAFVFDLISFLNLIFCSGIVVISIWWNRKTDSGTPLIIGAAFLLFGFSHLTVLLGLKGILEPALVVIRIIAYMLVFVGFIFIAREVMDRRAAEDETRRKNEDLNLAYEQLTSDEEELKQNYEELQKAEEALRESKERYRVLYDENPSMYFILDAGGKILSVNKYGAAQLGYSAVDLIKRPFNNILHAEDREKAEEQIKKSLESSGQAFSGEVRKVAKDGTVIWVREIMRGVAAEGGNMTVFVVSEDISEQKMATSTLDRATRKLNLLNRVVFTDIQNAVFSLHGYLELQNQLLSDNLMKEYVEKEINIVKTVNESLEFAKKFQSLGLRQQQWQNVEQVFLFAISHINFSSSRLTHRTDLNGLEIYADPSLEDVFFELADNSARHGMGATEISLYCRKTPEGLKLFFEDNGIGVPVADKETIFTKRVEENPGLGLFLSREILSITGISVVETGEPGKGARFEMTVPEGAYRFPELG